MATAPDSQAVTAPPAQNPAAVAPPVTVPPELPAIATFAPPADRSAAMANFHSIQLQNTFEAGRKKGIEEATTAVNDRIRSIIAVCTTKPVMALNAILSNQEPAAVKLAYDATIAAEATAAAETERKDLEIIRLQSLLALGGHPGVAMAMAAAEEAPSPEAIADPKAHAEREWDFKPAVRRGFTSKDRYVAVRVAELSGQFHTYQEQRQPNA